MLSSIQARFVHVRLQSAQCHARQRLMRNGGCGWHDRYVAVTLERPLQAVTLLAPVFK